MPPGPDTLMLSMAALIGGLTIFALLLLLGAAIVHWLRLPQDLPEGPRFEPPPPPTVAKGERQTAALIAAAQARLRAIYDQAHTVVRIAGECQDLHQQVETAGAVEPFATVAPVTQRCSATAIASATAAEQALTAIDQRLRTAREQVTDAELATLRQELTGHAQVADEALAQARAAVAPLPDGGNRRLLLLVGLLVVMIAWVIAMQFLLKK